MGFLSIAMLFFQDWVITDRPVLKSEIVITERFVPATVIPVAPSGRRFLAMFTANYCGPCQSWKANQKPKLEKSGYVVREYEMTVTRHQQKWGKKIRSYPTFVVVDWDTGEWIGEPIVGGIDFTTAVRLLDGPKLAAKKQAVTRVQPPIRYIQSETDGRYVKYGGTTYDMETWSRMCSLRSCGMCQYLDSMRAQYLVSKAAINSPQSSSSPDVVDEAIGIMKLTSSDVVAELGCGDGGPAIQMVMQSGCRVEGYEIDPVKVAEARRNVEAAGLSHRITIHEADLLKFDAKLHGITKAYCYLYPELLGKLAPRIQNIPLIVSAGHKIPELDGQVLDGQCWVRRI
jgi:hypothetical protein